MENINIGNGRFKNCFNDYVVSLYLLSKRSRILPDEFYENFQFLKKTEEKYYSSIVNNTDYLINNEEFSNFFCNINYDSKHSIMKSISNKNPSTLKEFIKRKHYISNKVKSLYLKIVNDDWKKKLKSRTDSCLIWTLVIDLFCFFILLLIHIITGIDLTNKFEFVLIYTILIIFSLINFISCIDTRVLFMGPLKILVHFKFWLHFNTYDCSSILNKAKTELKDIERDLDFLALYEMKYPGHKNLFLDVINDGEFKESEEKNLLMMNENLYLRVVFIKILESLEDDLFECKGKGDLLRVFCFFDYVLRKAGFDEPAISTMIKFMHESLFINCDKDIDYSYKSVEKAIRENKILDLDILAPFQRSILNECEKLIAI